jgi:hypothetical protein
VLTAESNVINVRTEIIEQKNTKKYCRFVQKKGGRVESKKEAR